MIKEFMLETSKDICQIFNVNEDFKKHFPTPVYEVQDEHMAHHRVFILVSEEETEELGNHLFFDLRTDTDSFETVVLLKSQLQANPQDKIYETLVFLNDRFVSLYGKTCLYQTLVIPKRTAKKIHKLLTHVPKNREECFGEDLTISHTVIFPDENEADIKLCGVQYEENEENLPWTEAVLFNNLGTEIVCSEVHDDYFGTWELETKDVIYKILVKEKD